MRGNSKNHQKHERIYLGLILLSALLFYAIFISRTAFTVNGEKYFTLVDDAMISMRYAKNLANGFGLVWNIGEPPIQGFSNLGWTLYMTLIHLLPIPPSKISLFVMITSAVILLGNAWLSFKICKLIAPQMKRAPIIAATITAFYYPLVFWSLRGMEVGIATFLVYAAVLLVIKPSQPVDLKKSLLLGLIVLLALIIRFDMILQITLILGYLLYDRIKQKTQLISLSPVLFFYLAGILGIFLFQYLYFGSLYPNTYYLKVEGVSIIDRVTVGIKVFVEYASRDFLTPLLIIVAGLFFFRDLRKKEVSLLLALFFIQCVYSIYIGGDYAVPLNSPQVDAANRFITQGMPSVIVLCGLVIDYFLSALLISSDPESRKKFYLSEILAIGLGLSILIIISGEPWFRWTIYNTPLLDADIWRTKLGIHIRNYTDEDITIAAHAAGQIPYYSNRRTIDLLGKSDSVVAKGLPASSFRPGHNKWNYEYSILTLKPDLIADEWGRLSEFLSDKPEYDRLDNGIYVRRDSFVELDELAQDYQK